MEFDSPKSIDWLSAPLPIGCDYENAAICEWFLFKQFPKSRIETEVKRQSCKTCSEGVSDLYGI